MYWLLFVINDIFLCIFRQMVLHSLHEVIQQVIDSQDDIVRALCAIERFSHDSGCTAVFMFTLGMVEFAFPAWPVGFSARPNLTHLDYLIARLCRPVILTASSKLHSTNRKLSCHKETLQLLLGSVLASTERGYFVDIIGLPSSTVTYLARKAIKFHELMQNKGYYSVQGHSRSVMLVPIEGPYATSY